jgi:peptidoglycan hydrolase FlgJ
MNGISLDPRMLYDQVKMSDNVAGRLKGISLDSSKSDFGTVLKSATESKTDKEQQLKKTCTAFEAIFVEQMLKSMRKNVQKSEFLHGGFAENVFEDMLYGEYAQKMSESGSFGFGKMLYESLSRYV